MDYGWSKAVLNISVEEIGIISLEMIILRRNEGFRCKKIKESTTESILTISLPLVPMFLLKIYTSNLNNFTFINQYLFWYPQHLVLFSDVNFHLLELSGNCQLHDMLSVCNKSKPHLPFPPISVWLPLLTSLFLLVITVHLTHVSTLWFTPLWYILYTDWWYFSKNSISISPSLVSPLTQL